MHTHYTFYNNNWGHGKGISIINTYFPMLMMMGAGDVVHYVELPLNLTTIFMIMKILFELNLCVLWFVKRTKKKWGIKYNCMLWCSTCDD